MKSNVIACVVARLKSTRLPKKALLPLCGKSMLEWLVERLRSAESIDRIVLCTSDHPQDRPLIDLAQEWGIDAVAGGQDDVLSRLILASKQFEADAVIRVTGDNVLTCPENIERLVARHNLVDADYTRTNGLPLGATGEVMATRMLQPLHDLMPDPNQSEYMSFFAFDPQHFHCEVLDALSEVHRPNYSVTVDTPQDFALMEYLFERFPGDGGPSLANAVHALDEDPGRCTILDDSPIRLPGGDVMTFGELQAMLSETANTARSRNAQRSSE
jgi:spore coat polysaccharide biosynthesis protein SpsF